MSKVRRLLKNKLWYIQIGTIETVFLKCVLTKNMFTVWY